MDIDSAIMDEKSRKKLEALKNPHVVSIVEKYVKLCRPSKVTVLDDSKEDMDYVRKLAIKNGEEKPLKMRGHTIHYDNYHDQARDLINTRVLLPKGRTLSKQIKTVDKEDGLKEIFSLMDGIMKGNEMLVCFYCLGPQDSKFTIPCLQLTDSAYVAHNEDLLYRKGYDVFRKMKGSKDFFHFVHSAGELDERKVCKNIGQRRVYIDLEEERVLSINNQYGGSSIGLKKLALRLSISKANREDWLCEHMFVMGIHPEGKKRVTYFTGAFPSMCGKTSTAMISGQTIVGDDIAFIRSGEDGCAYAANVECGIFGVIQDINPVDDSVIYKSLTTPRELIISNVLDVDGVPYWLGMGKEIPKKGINHSGEWHEGKKDKDGKTVDPSHKNARFTLRINDLDNADPKADDPEGVRVDGMIYGGRDSDTNVPVCQSLSWAHGVFLGCSIESETTAAALGKEGVIVHNPMANIEFLVVPLNVYIKNHMEFGERLDKPPIVFATNYFLKKDGKFLNEKVDKKVWILWMEGRVNGDYETIETPIGFIPRYEDLKALFKQVFGKEYTKEQYVQQFSIRISALLKRFDRISAIFKQEENIPETFFVHLDQQIERLKEAQEKYKKDVIITFDLITQLKLNNLFQALSAQPARNSKEYISITIFSFKIH
jgi:phosphoenolpyruvate carboxykinase (GTP)